ncbi:MAG: hypothetical protein J6J11_00595 [Treponema sp.]|nr:hypothetical protein [Clostridia bacterium]MBP3606799.1 hypothetical protein [Treponema sp.]
MSDQIFTNAKERQTLIEQLKEFLDETKNETLELKPKDFNETSNDDKSKAQVNKDLEVLEKDYSSDINSQLYNISENIVFTLRGLPEEKFKAVLDRFLTWGILPTMEEFIIDYYLTIKKDADLRQFVIMHFSKILKLTENILNSQSILRIAKQDFTNDNDEEIQILRNKLKEKEKELMNVMPEKFVKDESLDLIRNENKKQQIKQQILDDLKAQNPELENI